MNFKKTTRKIITISETYKDVDYPFFCFKREIVNNKKKYYEIEPTRKTPKDLYPHYYPDQNFKLTYDEVWNNCVYKFENIDDIDPKNIIYFYKSGHVIFDCKMNPIPTIRTFNYISSPFNNSVVDLDKALKILKKHPWVINKKELDIIDIPFYNSEPGYDKYISVELLPDKKSYKEMYEIALKKDKKFWSCRLSEIMVDFGRPSEEHNRLGLLKAVK